MTLPNQAQQHVFDLLKFEGYSRFIKSDAYQNRLKQEIKGRPLRFDPLNDLDRELRIVTFTASRRDI